MRFQYLQLIAEYMSLKKLCLISQFKQLQSNVALIKGYLRSSAVSRALTQYTRLENRHLYKGKLERLSQIDQYRSALIAISSRGLGILA